MSIDRPTFPPRAESVDSFSAQPATGHREKGKRTSDSPRPVSKRSNVITFPGRNPSFAYVRTGPLPPENVRQLEMQHAGRRRSAASMHTYVFRSYDLILTSPEADLVRDVRRDIHKAATKLNSIREQIRRDREHAAAREDLLTRAEARLAAAIDAAHPVRSLEG